MKSLSKSSQIPLYQQVVEWIRESIYTGDLVEDDRIPSEYQIMDMLEVSRGTVKKAVAQLVKEGVLIQVQGKDYCHSRNRWKARKYILPLKLLRHGLNRLIVMWQRN